MNLAKKTKKGFALIFVLLIAALMMVPVLMLLSSVAPRRTSVTGEAVSDRVLSVSDATIDRILSQINAFPIQVDSNTMNATVKDGLTQIGAYYTANPPSDSTAVRKVAVKYVMGYLLSGLNGGTIYQPVANADPVAPLQADATSYAGATAVDRSGTIWDIEDNVAAYFYNLDTQEYYAVWSTLSPTDPIASVTVLQNGNGINVSGISWPVKNLSTGIVKIGLGAWDPQFQTDNQWVEINANTQYTDTGTGHAGSTKFQIRTSAHLLSNSNAGPIVRNIFAEATLKLSDDSSIGEGGNPATGPFKYAIFSGTNFAMNGVHTVQSGHILPDGSIFKDGTGGSGDIFAGIDPLAKGTAISINGASTIQGRLVTSIAAANNPISLNGVRTVGARVYEQQETLPDFEPGTKVDAKAVAMAAGIYAGDFSRNGSGNTIDVLEKKYYSGNVSINGSGNTIKLYPLFNEVDPLAKKVDWYIHGDLVINGTATIDFGATPGIIWVDGNVSLNGALVIIGSGTIVAGGDVACNGVASSGDNEMAIVSEGGDINLNGSQNWRGIFYAPKGNVNINGSGSVFGSVAAGNSVAMNGNQNITYDTSISSGSGGTNPLLPYTKGTTTAGVSFPTARTNYRLSWREAIADPVTNANIKKLDPTFGFSS